MTIRSASANALGGAGYEHLEPLPDPPRELEMQQDIPIYDFRRLISLHLANRDDVLIAGGGYLRHDPQNESERFVPDCVISFGVNPSAIVGRNGYVISEVANHPTSSWKWPRAARVGGTTPSSGMDMQRTVCRNTGASIILAVNSTTLPSLAMS